MSELSSNKDIFRHLREAVAGNAVALAYIQTISEELDRQYQRLWYFGNDGRTYNDKDMRKYRKVELEALHDVAAALLVVSPTVVTEAVELPSVTVEGDDLPEKPGDGWVWILTMDRRRGVSAPTQLGVCDNAESMRQAVKGALAKAEGCNLAVRTVSDFATIYSGDEIPKDELWVCTDGTAAWSNRFLISAERFTMNELMEWEAE
ncbi:hypothetical protein ACIBCT_35205 [Streptosporangium sp. NPDC050855]|uniref:hypothetical protein n=1 Tax=Streptosporangium sp. NPDC050855 TaxID=3366194 RepID=UPI00379B6E2C